MLPFVKLALRVHYGKRKLAELGYHRSAKKCKEKFENVYKYHKRTKDGRSGKADGKTYRFFDQLEAFQSQPSIQSPPQLKPAMEAAATNLPHVNVPSTTLPSVQQNILPPNINLTLPPSFPSTNPNPTSQSNSPPPQASPTIPSFPSVSSADLMLNSTSSSTSSDLGLEGHRKRKRKWKEFFERLMKEVIEKQEEMQNKFLEAIEKRERERMVLEEAWRMQEVSRLNREREILSQERSIAAAKDAAVMAFLHKLSGQKQQPNPENNPLPPQQQQHHHQQQTPSKPVSEVALADTPAPPPVPPQGENLDVSKSDNGDQSYTPSSSRWPKVEIEALIKLRANLDAKYQDSGPKGPLWEEISAAMKRLGYNRNAKRCKEKWENINKYFKKVKESNKKRPEDSKTCPYFHQLDALYREKNKHDSSKYNPQNSVPLMVRPEQQWPPPPQPQHHHVMEDMESDQNQDEDDDEEDEDEGGSFEIVASKQVSMSTNERSISETNELDQ
ncbi:trihelix transcription factor GT-2-like isoform X2 [Hibiscus syriacus]|uniref:trihelix transcription factor GT-2-like isoform X2 n=1 Tax=Hibiscus syriacus TaxID=106335 RepID=UPI001923A589|nr:trihelix transcription factor GT-2-like isoform X2 [Hibiscus syriacus]